MRLLSDKMEELISHEKGCTVLKNELKPRREKSWLISPLNNSAFVAQMERVLDVYKKPCNTEYPVICLDELSKQLIRETR